MTVPPVLVSVNLSARQLHRPGLIEDVEDALEEGGLESRLTLEITEGLVIGERERHLGALRAVRERG